MRWLIVLLSVLAFAIALSDTAPLAAQAPDALPGVEAAAAPTATQDAPAPRFGLPSEGQPRTLSHLWHVFLAYAAVWVLLFGYVLTVGRRFGKLEAEVRQLVG
jgi:CcmD family protein